MPSRVWLLLGDKLGDNAQVELIVQALGWNCERKRLIFLEPYRLGKPRFAASLHHLDRDRSDPLQPPWPDLILTIGRRPSMAALWVRRQSGNRTRLVLLGRPKSGLDDFALIIAPAQYRLPERPNVLSLELPLIRVNREAVATAADRWRPRLAELPRPLTALLVGGQTKPFILDATVAGSLITQVRHLVQADGGSLYVSTSRRTAPAVADALQAGLPAGARCYRWSPAAADNPYLALLGLADRFIVTGDSISMLVEVAQLGKPLAIFPLPIGGGPLERLQRGLEHWLHPDAGDEHGGLRALGEALYRSGLLGYTRDLTAIHRLLIQRGRAVRLGEPLPPPGPGLTDELSRVVERVAALVQNN